MSTGNRSFSVSYDETTDDKRALGARGEALVAQATGGRLNDETEGYDDGIDVITPEGLLIDVKTIDNPNHRLFVRTERQQYSSAEIYVLVLEHDGTRRIVGGLPAPAVYAREPETIWRPMPPNDVFAVPQDDLRPLERLL